MLGKQTIPSYGSNILYAPDGNSGGGDGASGGASAGNGDQTNWKQRYDDLTAQIQTEYVPKKSYVSLQQTLQQAADAKKTAEELAAQAQGKALDLETQFTTTKSAYEQLQGTSQQAQAELEQYKTTVQRNKLIMEKFPGLAQFEGKGLLPTAPLEELESKLTDFQATLGQFQGEKVADFKKGESPDEPPAKQPDGKKTSATLLQEATQFQKEFKFDQYEQAMTQYYAALQREGKA